MPTLVPQMLHLEEDLRLLEEIINMQEEVEVIVEFLEHLHHY